jgi:hypothetical protein
MHSLDVDNMVTELDGFASKFMETDFGGYDTSMPPDIGAAANTIEYNVCKSLGYNEKALRILLGILSDDLMPTVVLNGALFRVPGYEPSGKYGTAENNTLRGLVLLVYSWIAMMTPYGKKDSHNVTTQYSPEDFWNYVLPYIYGDDEVAGVKDEVIDKFNNLTFAAFVEEKYGMTCTPANKGDQLTPYLSLNEISFLKRTFKWRDDLQHFVAPLALDSVMKAFCYRIPSKNVSEIEQVVDSTVSALRELFFHLTEKEYEMRRLLFVNLVSKEYDVLEKDLLKIYPTFQQIRMSCYPTDFMDLDTFIKEVSDDPECHPLEL